MRKIALLGPTSAQKKCLKLKKPYAEAEIAVLTRLVGQVKVQNKVLHTLEMAFWTLFVAYFGAWTTGQDSRLFSRMVNLVRYGYIPNAGMVLPQRLKTSFLKAAAMCISPVSWVKTYMAWRTRLADWLILNLPQPL